MPIDGSENIYETCWDHLGQDIGITKVAALRPIWWNIINQFQKEGYTISELFQGLYLAMLDAKNEDGTNQEIWDKAVDCISETSRLAYRAEELERENQKLHKSLKGRIDKGIN